MREMEKEKEKKKIGERKVEFKPTHKCSDVFMQTSGDGTQDCVHSNAFQCPFFG